MQQIAITLYKTCKNTIPLFPEHTTKEGATGEALGMTDYKKVVTGTESTQQYFFF